MYRCKIVWLFLCQGHQTLWKPRRLHNSTQKSSPAISQKSICSGRDHPLVSLEEVLHTVTCLPPFVQIMKFRGTSPAFPGSKTLTPLPPLLLTPDIFSCGSRDAHCALGSYGNPRVSLATALVRSCC